ncbi:MAG TPA: heme-binding protein [Xanthobacteraceae bacterium]|nr:heme-binding protein [Xanthobacteraceae bacterium]
MRLRGTFRGRAATLAFLLLLPCMRPASAQGLIKKTYLPIELAYEALTTAVATCAAQGQHVSGVVLDPDGLQQAFLRGDGAGIHTVETADYKANTTLSFRTDGVDLVERSKTRPPPGPIGKLPRLLLAQGGVLIKAGDEIVGAIGISGGAGNNIDTACARAGVDKIKDRLK